MKGKNKTRSVFWSLVSVFAPMGAVYTFGAIITLAALELDIPLKITNVLITVFAAATIAFILFRMWRDKE